MKEFDATTVESPANDALYEQLTTMQAKVWPVLKQLDYLKHVQLNAIVGNQTVDFYAPQLKLAIVIRTSDITGSTAEAYAEYFKKLDIKLILVSFVDMLLHPRESRNRLMSHLIQRQRDFLQNSITTGE